MTSNNICNFCNKIFSTKQNLSKHLRTTKYCIKLQSEKDYINKNIELFQCEYCKKEFINKCNLTKHLDICKVKIIKNNIATENKDTENIIKDLELQNNILKGKLELEIKNIEIINNITEENIKLKGLLEENTFETIIKLREEVSELKVYKTLYDEKIIRINELEKEVKSLYEKTIEDKNKSQKSYENLASKAIEKAGNKTYNKIIQNLIPLTDEYIQEQSKFLQLKHVINGSDSLAIFAKDISLKDRVICTDVARRNFIFKDENDNIIKDPKGVKITKKFIDNNKSELIRLIKEYLLTFYDDDTTMTLKEKQEAEDLLYAIKYSNEPDTADSYNKFEKQFTVCFSKLVYNKNYEDLE
jgi:hypothetical protein